MCVTKANVIVDLIGHGRRGQITGRDVLPLNVHNDVPGLGRCAPTAPPAIPLIFECPRTLAVFTRPRVRRFRRGDGGGCRFRRGGLQADRFRRRLYGLDLRLLCHDGRGRDGGRWMVPRLHHLQVRLDLLVAPAFCRRQGGRCRDLLRVIFRTRWPSSTTPRRFVLLCWFHEVPFGGRGQRPRKPITPAACRFGPHVSEGRCPTRESSASRIRRSDRKSF